MRARHALAAVLLLTAGQGWGDSGPCTSSRGSLGLSLSHYPHSGTTGGFVGRGALTWRCRARLGRLRAGLGIRLARTAGGPTVVDLPGTYLRWRRGTLSMEAGMRREVLGTLEAWQPLDVFNARDWTDGPWRFERLATPSLRLAWTLRPELRLAVDWSPRVRNPAWPDGGALRPYPLPLVQGRRFDRRGAVQLRADLSQGPVELALAFWRGPSREPHVRPAPGRAALRPVFPALRQTAVALSVAAGDVLVKVEAGRRWSGGVVYTLGGAGITWFQPSLAEGRASGALLIEWYRDLRPDSLPPVLFDKDLYVGYRLDLPGAADARLQLGVIRDLRRGSTVWVAEGARRLGDRITLILAAEAYRAGTSDRAMSALDDDDRVLVEMRWHW